MILEMNENRTDEENEKLESKSNDVSKLRAKIGSGSIRVFEQIDADKSGKIERADLMKILGELPGTQEGEDNIEGLIKLWMWTAMYRPCVDQAGCARSTSMTRPCGRAMRNHRRHGGVASMAWRSTRRFSTNAP